jgi:hypothetical protein
MRRLRITLWLAAFMAIITTPLMAASSASAMNGPWQAWVNLDSGLCLTATGGQGSLVTQTKCPPAGASIPDAQQWNALCFNLFCDGGNFLWNKWNDLCAHVLGGPANGTNIIMMPCAKISDQNWSVTFPHVIGIPDRAFYMRSHINFTDSHCLDVRTKNPGQQMQLWKCNLTKAQLFVGRAV